VMNASADTAPMDAHTIGDLPQRKLAYNTNTLGTRGGSSSDSLLGAGRGRPSSWVRFPWEPVVATNGGGLHFLHLCGCRVITVLDVLVTGRVEHHFISSPT